MGLKWPSFTKTDEVESFPTIALADEDLIERNQLILRNDRGLLRGPTGLFTNPRAKIILLGLRARLA
jgi:hypothetical protein